MQKNCIMRTESYEELAKSYRQARISLQKSSTILLMGKITAFILSLLFAVQYYHTSADTSLLGIGLFLFIYAILYKMDSKYQKEIARIKKKEDVCHGERAYLRGDFQNLNTGEEYIDTEHPYSFDLDIFGEKSLYQRVNRTVTQIGSDCLAAKLNTLSEKPADIARQQAAIAELSQKERWRIDFMARPYIHNSSVSLSELTKEKGSRTIGRLRYPGYVLIALTWTSLALAICNIVPWSIFSSLFLFQLILATVISKQTKNAVDNAEKIHKEFLQYTELLACINKEEFKSDNTSEIYHKLFHKNGDSLTAFHQLTKTLNLFDQRMSGIIYLLFNGFILYDLYLVIRFNNWKKRYVNETESWLQAIGEMDALVSLSTYAYNHPEAHYADFIEGKENLLKASNIHHPFIPSEKAVSNDFVLNRKNIAIITGANMAGKSTFLRTIGISYVMAANGLPVCAEKFEFAPLSLFTGMRTADNLAEETSYFHAELKRLEALIHHIQTHTLTLIILDEILKGTNSKDKLEGSIMFLEDIKDKNIAALIATHDLELSRLEERDSSTYRNYCFEIDLSKKLPFSYKIERGVAQNLNASYLLSQLLANISH